MVAWINALVLVIATKLFLYFYVRSVGPAALERRVGERAWRRCMWYRVIAGGFEFVIMVNYVLYVFYPLPIGLPERFPWPWWGSVIIAAAVGIPAGWLMYRGLSDAGEESLAPKRAHPMFGGIYQRMRHPQATGEMPLFWALAFALHSPFLVLWSFVYLPVFIVMCRAEERDLLLRYGQAYEDYRHRVGVFFPRQR
ncbi:MAG: isoprenylcysteine carboxylmethyltransferase family protein [Candidatus Neomarinimicrobiota bacterium]